MRRIMPCAAVLAIASYANAAARQADFNGDGRADLAISVPNERVAGFDGAGAVAVIYGKNANGLNSAGDQLWTQDSPGINGVPATNAHFGTTLAAGDFDGDGFSDLAIGVPYEIVNGVNAAGAVSVIYGSASGLKSAGDQLWHRDVAGVEGDPAAFALFGFALAAGDFDNDGRDDLAIGIRQQDVNGVDSAGEVHVLYGSNSGLSAGGDQVLNQDTTGVESDPDDSDFFGSALATGDFDGDGRDDLAIDVPGETVGAATGAGAVHVLYGTSGGLDVDGAQFLTQDTGDIDDVAETGDGFGTTMASGDFDGNGKDDLVIGVLLEEVEGQASAGAVHVLYGSNSGLRTDDPDFFTQATPGIPNSPNMGDRFGYALAAGDFDHDNRDDLAIGVPYEDIGGVNAAGAVHVLYGKSGGLSADGDQFWHQDSNDIQDAAQDSDYFGIALAVGDFDNDNRDDLAVGAMGETIGGLNSAGAVNVIYGKDANGLHRDGNQFWHQDSAGINDATANGELFGAWLR